MVKLVARLSSEPSRRKNTILAKRHKIANPLRRIVLVEWDAKNQLRRVFLPRVESEWRRAPKNQRSLRRERIPSPPRRDISRRGRTRGNLFYNAKKGKILRLSLEEMSWKQGPTTIFVDNTTASGICNSKIKRQQLRAMNGQYFWLVDQVNLNTYRIKWAPGLKNMADYFTKHFRGSSSS